MCLQRHSVKVKLLWNGNPTTFWKPKSNKYRIQFLINLEISWHRPSKKRHLKFSTNIQYSSHNKNDCAQKQTFGTQLTDWVLGSLALGLRPRQSFTLFSMFQKDQKEGRETVQAPGFQFSSSRYLVFCSSFVLVLFVVWFYYYFFL